MKVCPRCRSLFGEGGKVCPVCELKLEPFSPKSDPDEEKGLKATIPEGVRQFLNLESGDKLEWDKQTIDGKEVVIVKRKSGIKDNSPKESVKE